MTSSDALVEAAPPSAGTLALEVTARCNRACAYCYNEWRDSLLPQEPEMDTHEWVTLARRAILESGRSHLQITGGEPLLRDDLFEIISELRHPGRRISLVSDAGLMDDRAVNELLRLGVGPVQPTLLAGNREVHDGLKGVVSFDATVAAIVRLIAARVPVSVSFVCTSKNYGYFREMVELCFALGVKTIAFSRFCTAGAGSRRHVALLPTVQMISECLDVGVWATEALGMRVAIAISLPLCVPSAGQRSKLAFGRCALGTEAPGYTIDPWGRLRACSISGEILGDLRHESWSAITKRAKHLYFPRVSTAPEECRSCSLVQQCGGGCRESARAAFGTFDRADPLVLPPLS